MRFVKSPSRRKRPRQVALLGLPVLRADSLFNEILLRYARDCGHWEFVFSGAANVKTFRFLRELDCDGAIVRIISPEMREEALRVGFPMVNISNWLEDAGVSAVRTDEDASGRICAEHLLARGFCRFGIVRMWGGWFAKARSDGFLKAIEAAGYGGNTSLFEVHASSLVVNRKEMERFRAWVLTLRPPAALFLTDDETAPLFVGACRAAGLRIPHDVAVIVAYWRQSSVDCEPSLSHVDVAHDLLMFEAARRLDRLMKGDTRGSRSIRVPPRGVVAMRSTDTLAVDDPMAARAVEFIREHSGENINVKVIAERLSFRRRTLEEHFIRAMGLSIHQFLIQQRIAHAHDLLQGESTLSLREIASRCGFYDARHMKRILKRDGASGPLR